MTREEVEEYLVQEAEYSLEAVLLMTNDEMFDAWLRYEGIIGYTLKILNMIEAIYEINEINEL